MLSPFRGLVFQECENQLLFAQAVGAVDFVGDGHLYQFGDVEVLEVG